MKGTGRVVAMAVARTHVAESVQTRVDWRTIAKRAYYLTTALAAAALIVFVPPHFNFSIQTLVAVFVISWFLIAVERAEGTTYRFAPLTAVLAASVAIVGWWSLVLSAMSWAVIRWRLNAENKLRAADAIPGFFGQVGIGILAIYATLGAYYGLVSLGNLVPVWLAGLVTFVAIVAAGFSWQTTNNVLGAVTYWILGKGVSLRMVSRAGFVASIWAYFLVAIYTFGGIAAIVGFYLVVANTRMMDKMLGVIASMEKLENVQTQAGALLQEVSRLAEGPDDGFAADVRHIAVLLARRLALTKSDIDNIGMAASLHEIGKCELDPAIRKNDRNLTEGQRMQYLRYSTLGGRLLRNASTLVPEDVAAMVEQHTEHFDGTGYPYAINGERIPLGARILSLARGYVVLLTGHDGAEIMPKQNALEAMSKRAGTQYDPGLVDLLCRTVD